MYGLCECVYGHRNEQQCAATAHGANVDENITSLARPHDNHPCARLLATCVFVCTTVFLYVQWLDVCMWL